MNIVIILLISIYLTDCNKLEDNHDKNKEKHSKYKNVGLDGINTFKRKKNPEDKNISAAEVNAGKEIKELDQGLGLSNNQGNKSVKNDEINLNRNLHRSDLNKDSFKTNEVKTKEKFEKTDSVKNQRDDSGFNKNNYEVDKEKNSEKIERDKSISINKPEIIVKCICEKKDCNIRNTWQWIKIPFRKRIDISHLYFFEVLRCSNCKKIISNKTIEGLGFKNCKICIKKAIYKNGSLNGEIERSVENFIAKNKAHFIDITRKNDDQPIASFMIETNLF